METYYFSFNSLQQMCLSWAEGRVKEAKEALGRNFVLPIFWGPQPKGGLSSQLVGRGAY